MGNETATAPATSRETVYDAPVSGDVVVAIDYDTCGAVDAASASVGCAASTDGVAVEKADIAATYDDGSAPKVIR